MPRFVRFSGILKSAFFAVLFVFTFSNAYAATCPTGYQTQTNLFENLQHCGVQNTVGYEHTGNGSENSPISGGDGTWISYFSSFRLKGKAYCSTTQPTTAEQPDKCATRRPMAESIDTSNSGTYCWCQATEHRQRSATSGTWNAPFQKIYAKYVYVKDMGNDCQNSCAAYCSYMSTNLSLDASVHPEVGGENVRATVYDSLLECIPTEHKITYISDGETIDYQYYTGAVKLKAALEKPDYYFKGWCLNSPNCTDPMAAESTKTGWSGQKTLHAKWERTSCGEGIKSESRNGTLYCSTECKDGYEKQFNPMSFEYSSASNEPTFCHRTGNGSEKSGYNWSAWFSSFSYVIRGHAFCSTTAPNQPTIYRDAKCSAPIYPMLENIDTENTGAHCWCQATEYEQLYDKKLSKGKYPVDAKWVYAGTPYNCSVECASSCASISVTADTANEHIDTMSMRVSIYRSVKMCSKKSYTLTLKNGGYTINTFNNYTVTDSISLPTPPEQSGFVFAGWCEDLSDCDTPLIGTVTGLFGDKTLYAKWDPKTESSLLQITYETNGGVLPESAPTVAVKNSTVTLVPTQSDTLVFEGWYNNPEFDGTSVSVLHIPSSQTENIKLYAKQSSNTEGGSTSDSGENSGSDPDSGSSSGSGSSIEQPSEPINCAAGYDKNPSGSGVLDPSVNTSYYAYISADGQSKITRDMLSKIRENDNSSKGKWGVVFPRNSQNTVTTSNYLFEAYGTSSCNTSNGENPPNSLTYSMLSNVANTTGGNCWCKTTEFTQNGQSTVSISSTSPWVYLKTFSESTGSTGCERNCAMECALKARNSAFFRSHVFGAYSACKAATYSIDYSLNGGTFDDGTNIPNQYTIEYKNVIAPTTLSKEHYVFDAWCEDANLTIGCSAQKTISTGSFGNKILYAKWAPVKYDINYNLPGDAFWPAGSTHPNKYDFGSGLAISNPTRNGYVFAGWCVGNNNCSNNQLQKSFSVTPQMSGTINLYPYWTESTYTIRYKTMDGTEIPGLTPNEYIFNTEIDLPTNVIMDNYTFNNWRKTQDVNSDIATTIPAGTYGNQIFYADMTAKQYGITYYDGTTTITYFPEQYSEYTYGTGITLPETATKEHYNFVGWYDNADLTGNAITQISTTNSGNQEIWAKWEPKTYTITCYSDSTKTEVADVISYTVENIPSLPEISKTHFEFDGWRDDDGNAVTEINPENDENLELYATWTRISCEDGHYLTDGDCEVCPSDYPYADGKTATTQNDCYAMCPSNLVCPDNSEDCDYDDNVNENYLNYYHESQSPCGIVYNCKTHYRDTGTTCVPKEYTITYYDGNQSINADDFGLPKSYTYGENTPLPQTPTKPYYTFAGWFSNADLTGEIVEAILSTDHDAKEFYAKWDAVDYHIEFRTGTAGTRTTGFTGTMQNKPVYYGEKDIILPESNFAIDGYEFKEWLCSATKDTGEIYTEKFQSGDKIGEYDFVDAMICVAQWKSKAYTMYYDCGDGELSDDQSATTTFNYDATYVLTPSVCKTRDNYTLSGWTCTNNFDTTNMLWNIPQDTECTAHWTEKTYRIRYLESDETVIAGMEPQYYRASVALTVPYSEQPTREHFRFVGWCDDKNLTTNCKPKRIIPVGTNTDPKVFYAKWAATECESGQYLEDGVCIGCPSGYYTDDAWGARTKNECYFDCGDICPTGASECTFVGGAQNGRVYWDEDNNYSCDIDVRCKDGYNAYTNNAGRPDCAIINYRLIYYNVDDTDWGTLAHPDYYNVNDPAITIGALTRDGYIFAGWCEGEDGCEMPLKIFPINPATMNSLHNIKLYAQWKIEESPVTPEEFVCTSGHVLHIGDDTLCLSTTPVGKPALGFGNSNKKYYLQMTKKNAGSNGVNINKDSKKQLNILYKNEVYNVHDASVGND